MSLKNKIALVTGASSGIGEAVSYCLAQNGVNLILMARSQDKLEALQKELEKKVSVKTLVVDVREENQVIEAIKSLEPKWQDIDILINNAGLVLGLDKFHETSLQDYNTVMSTNMQGLVYVTHAVLPLILKHKKPADIINIGSVAGDVAYQGGSIYCASKAMVKTFTDGLRIDLVDTPIRVCNVKPGLVETNFSKVRFKGDSNKASKVYEGIDALNGENIAKVIESILLYPYPIQIAEITVLPVNQASGTVVSRKTH